MVTSTKAIKLAKQAVKATIDLAIIAKKKTIEKVPHQTKDKQRVLQLQKKKTTMPGTATSQAQIKRSPKSH